MRSPVSTDSAGSIGADPLARYSLSPAEGAALAAAGRAGLPFLAYREPAGTFHVFTLEPGPEPLFIGRADGASLQITGDQQVSRLHAELRPASGEWMITNLSQNNTFVNSKPIDRPERLRDGDRIRVGRIVLAFNWPGAPDGDETSIAHDQPRLVELSPTQRRILIALCRPMLGSGELHAPASNKEICDEVYLGPEQVKKELGRLFGRFGFVDLPQNQKRASLANYAINTGLVARRDL